MEETGPIIVLQKSTGVIRPCVFTAMNGTHAFTALPNGKKDLACFRFDISDQKFANLYDFRIYLRQLLPKIGYELLENNDKRIPNELLCEVKKTFAAYTEES